MEPGQQAAISSKRPGRQGREQARSVGRRLSVGAKNRVTLLIGSVAAELGIEAALLDTSEPAASATRASSG